MSSLNTFVDCPNLQDNMEKVFCTGTMESLPIISFLFSDINNGSVLEQRAVSGSGNKRTVELIYTRRVLESEVDNYINYDVCTGTIVRGESSTTYDLDLNTGVEITRTVNLVDLITRCESSSDYFAKVVKDLIEGAERAMETYAATTLVSLAGGFPSIDYDYDGSAIDASTKKVRTKLTAGGIDFNGLQEIAQSARLGAYCSAPVVIGDYEIAKYFNAVQNGCCAATGVDFSSVAQGLPTLLPSYRVPNAMNDVDKFLVMSAGAALPIWFNLYAGDAGRIINDAGSRMVSVVVSPRGIPFDLSVVEDCNQVHIKVSLAWQLFAAPTTLFEDSDPLDGVNFINKFEVTNP